MKKFLTVSLLLLLIASMSVCLAGCFFSSDKDDKNDSSTQEEVKETKMSVTVYDGDYSKTYSFKVNEENKVEPLYKADLYLKGFYDKQEGGTKYFETDGVATGIWQESNPTELYAQWGDIYDLQDEWKKYFDDTYTIGSGGGFTITYSKEMANAILGNLDKKIEVNINCLAKDSYSNHFLWLKLQDTRDSDYEVFDSYSCYDSTTIYQELNFTLTGNARCGKKGYSYIYVSRGNDFGQGYMKDATITARFVK